MHQFAPSDCTTMGLSDVLSTLIYEAGCPWPFLSPCLGQLEWQRGGKDCSDTWRVNSGTREGKSLETEEPNP